MRRGVDTRRRVFHDPAPDGLHVAAIMRPSLPSLWADAGPEGRQALASALFTKLEVEGYTKMRYQLSPDVANLGLGAALPTQLETGVTQVGLVGARGVAPAWPTCSPGLDSCSRT